jgi:protein tyrosine phosphatase
VQHWWYTEWPDHGVPTDAAGKFDCVGILSMLKKMDELKDGTLANKYPQLVHCSAGVGQYVVCADVCLIFICAALTTFI